MNSKGNVAHARRTASRCGKGEKVEAPETKDDFLFTDSSFIPLTMTSDLQVLLLVASYRGASDGTEVLVLGQPVFLHFWGTIFIGTAIDRRRHFEVAMRCRRRRRPLKSVGLPGIALGLFAGEQTVEKISQEK